MAVTVELVGGPKDGEVAMLAEAIPQLELFVPAPTAHLRLVGTPPAKIVPVRLIYCRRDGPPRLDGVLFYDFGGVST